MAKNVRKVLRAQWTKTGFILASIGAAVGLGNIWRFPYMVGENGGGAFLIPYLIGVIIFGIPLIVIELEVGRKYKGSVITTLKKVNRKVWFVGILAILVSLGILSYYLVICGWALAYTIFSVTKFTSFSSFTNSLLPLLFFIISLLIVVLTVSRGIKRGIEKMAMVLMPLFIALVGALTIYSLTLPGAKEAVLFYLHPDFSYLLNIKVWILGFAQAFFSIAVGYGILMTYGSYLSKKDNIMKASVEIASADTFIAVLSGLLIFPIIFTFGLNPAAGSQLTFISLPLAFSLMPFGFIIGAFFFFLLFSAGITSAVSMIEVGVSTLIDELNWTRKKSAWTLSILIFLAGLPSALSYFGKGLFINGQPLIEYLDSLFGSLLLLSAALTCATIMWVYKPKSFSKWKIAKPVYFFLKYLVPLILIGILIYDLVA